MNAKIPKTHVSRSLIKKQGFTLTEVLVTLGVFSILIPPILLVGQHMTRQSVNGVDHNDSVAAVRSIQQHFIQLVSSSDGFHTQDNGNILALNVYDSSVTNWIGNALVYVPAEHALKVYKQDTSGQLKVEKTLSTQAFYEGSNKVFSAAGGLVRMQLVVNHSPYADQGKGHSGAVIDISISPRNSGRSQ